jgi:hypothetical protein
MTADPIDVRRLRDRAERLCRRVAALDLGDVPLYIVLQSECGGTADDSRSQFWGFFDETADLVYRAVIGDRWRGRGPAIVVSDLQLSRDCDSSSLDLIFRNVVFHELAHVLECWRGRPPAVPPPETIARKGRLFKLFVEERHDETRDELAAFREPWFLHEVPFIRACCHLAYRLRRRGVHVTAAALLCGNDYGLSPIQAYERALNREPKRARRLPIHRVLQLPAPEAERLFAEDVAAWRTRQPKHAPPPTAVGVLPQGAGGAP